MELTALQKCNPFSRTLNQQALLDNKVMYAKQKPKQICK